MDRKFPRSGRRSIIDYGEIATQSGQYVVTCLNRSVLGIARVLLGTRGLWPTTYATSYDSDGYDIPDSSEMDLIESLISEFLEDTSDMDCTDFANSLSDIRAAIAGLSSGGGCGCGAQGGGENDEPAEPLDTGTPYQHTGDPPEGFADWNEYDTYKCDVADWIVDSHLQTFQTLQTYNLVGITLAAVVLGIFTPIPGDGLLAFLAFLLAIAGVFEGVLANIEDAITNNKAALICSLFDATNATDAYNDYIAEIDLAIDGEALGQPQDFLARQGYKLLANYTTMNLLFVKDNFRTFPVGDCTSCGVCGNWTIITGDLEAGSLDGDGSGFTVGAIWAVGGVPTCSRYQIHIQAPADCDCRQFSWSAPGLTPHVCPGDGYATFYEDCTLGAQYLTGAPPVTLCLEASGQLIMRSSVDFSLAVTLEGGC